MYDTVLVPTDGSEVSYTAADEAVTITAGDGTIHALAVVEELPMHKQSGKPKLKQKDDTQKQLEMENAADRISQIATGGGVNCVTELSSGVPHREIVTYADEVDADAIVMGKRGLSATADDMLGSTTERVIRDSDRTVVAVPE